MRGRWLLLALTALTLRMVPLAAEGRFLFVQPAAPRQGEAMVVFLAHADAEHARASWRGHTYPLYASGQGWIGVLPIVPETPAGKATLTVAYTIGGKREKASQPVTIQRTAFPVEHLKMAPQTARLYTYPGVKKEDAIVWGATQVKSAEQLWHGDWVLPAQGRLSDPFGVRRLRNGQAAGRHRGQDISAAQGSPILAPAAAKVVLTGRFKKHGNAVVLDHGQGVTSLYLHMSKIEVKKGQTVAKGAEIGKVGSTGAATGPHLHWSVYAQGQPVNPLFFCRLSKRGVKLPKGAEAAP